MSEVNIYRAKAGVLHTPQMPIDIPVAGRLIGEVWEHECGHGIRIIMVPDNDEIRTALENMGYRVQPAAPAESEAA